jgi:putative FmdB family regulatory protein
MPLYEYRCEDCDHGFELLVRESTTLECPACHGHKLEKLLSVFAVGAEGRSAASRAAAPGPCGACGHPDGPGSCSVN